MDSNELRNLQEAYLDVYAGEQLDEALTGERYRKAIKKPGGTAYSRKVSADPEKRATRGGRGGESDFGAGDRGAGNKAARRSGTYQEEEVSIYDIVLSHLIDEGYADTVESAEGIMVNMSEEWRDSIVEVLTGDRYKKAIKKPGGTSYSRKVSADPAKRATRGGRGGESDFGAGDRGSGNKSRRRRGLKVDYDIND